ncbi:MAG: hypothetical protein IAE89_01725 [Anaerolineae bacterium]|nr:hypothetical protein [Anaerolineae bacterium]
MTTAAQIPELDTPRARVDILWLLSVIFVVVAMLTSGYLSYTKLFNESVICVENSTFDCNAVTSSVWSKFPQNNGIDVAYLGFISYTTLLVLLILEKKVGFFKQYGLYLIFGLIMFDFMFHSYLTYNSLFVLQKACIWCLATHLMAFLTLIVTTIRFWKHLSAEPSAEVQTV